MALLGNPFVANIPKQLTDQELVQAIRVDIAGELEAIIGYEAHASSTTNQNAKDTLIHIANEEKRHVGMLEQVLFELSQSDAQYFEQGKQDALLQR